MDMAFLLATFPLLGVTVEPAGISLDAPRIERLAVLATSNYSAPGATFLLLGPCGITLSEHSVFGLAEGSASEEWTRSRGSCACGSTCALYRPLRYEHEALEPISLMPPAFQPPEEGRRLNARPEPYESPQHERAAHVVAKAQHWIGTAATTLGGGPDKLPLRRLLLALALTLVGACLGALLFKLLEAVIRRPVKR